ncbi:hypothetical protein QUF64_07285 [Anaerolineales bacterium HSG6]|nr:hypothetical protein [Anaerolineales bacterium HSG6]MDM8532535.1 hypothetical protein [Anaerolineales bacterium HSG25]
MELVEIEVNPNPIGEEYMAQAFFEWNGQEWEMTVKAGSPDEAKALAESQSASYLSEWNTDASAANQKYSVYMF